MRNTRTPSFVPDPISRCLLPVLVAGLACVGMAWAQDHPKGAALAQMLADASAQNNLLAGGGGGKKPPPVFEDLPAEMTRAGGEGARPDTQPPAPAPAAVPVPTPVPAPTPVAAPPPPPPPATVAAVVHEAKASADAAPGLEQHTQDKRVFGFKTENTELKTALALFARANKLNIVPDNDITGTVTLDVSDLPLAQMMRALLEANDCVWEESEGLIRVRAAETKMFVVDYLRLSRKGQGMSSAMLSAGSSSGMGGMSGGMGGGGMGGGMSMGGGGMGGGMGGGGMSGGGGGSSVNLSAENDIDFWKELKEEIGFMLTDKGKSTLAINKTAGLLQITDRPSALKRVDRYFQSLKGTIQRQVEIEAKIYDVTLGDNFQFGIDWVSVAKAYGGSLGYGALLQPQVSGGIQTKLPQSALAGLNSLGFGGPALVFSNLNTRAAVDALSAQGNVEVISKPRIRTLNNQTALIKVGTDMPFFMQSSAVISGGTDLGTTTSDQVSMVTVGAILALTPQISEDDMIALDVSPVLTSFEDRVKSPSGNSDAPQIQTKQASSLIRIPDGSTAVMGGLIQNSKAKTKRKVPVIGDIPVLGFLFTGTYEAKQKKELVIFITPTIVK